MFNFILHNEVSNQHNNATTIRMGKPKTLTTPNAGEDLEQREHSFTENRNAKWFSHFGRHFGRFFQN